MKMLLNKSRSVAGLILKIILPDDAQAMRIGKEYLRMYGIDAS